MERRLYKELWSLRFKRMLDIENKSVKEYDKLLALAKKTGHHPSVVDHLEILVTDEKKHAHLCEELLKILARQAE